MECTACGKTIVDGEVTYELNKGSWMQPPEAEEGEFNHEEQKGLYHEKCLPANVPQEEED